MAVKRSKKKLKAKKTSDAYRQALFAEGAPAILDLLGLGGTIRDAVGGRRRRTAAKPSAKKKTRAKVKTTRARKTSLARKVRRRKTTRSARA